MKLYPHQEKFLKSDNDHAILCWEAGTGKTHAAKVWLHQNCHRESEPVVLCPKQVVPTWEETDATVYSFEQFKKATKEGTLPEHPSAIIVDEADMMASPLFVAKQRSQRTADLYTYIMENPDADVLLLTATPVRSTPWNIHTLLVLARIKSGDTWKKFRETYFSKETTFYSRYPIWLPQKDWRPRMQKLIDKYTHIALMKDMVDLPPETHEVIKLKEPNYEQNEEWEAAKQFAEDHRLEQSKKDKSIKEISRGYRKVVVVAKYRSQIDDLQKQLGKERETFVLDGRTKDVGRVIADAEASSECYFIIQAQVGAGFELPSFAVMIFASQSYGARDYVQIKARIKRINALKPLKYYYLQAGKCDRAVYKSVKQGLDYIPSEYKA